jgi:hypothetical protein
MIYYYVYFVNLFYFFPKTCKVIIYKDNFNMPKRFTKKQEDFICENCGQKVQGTGYTNHCPKCLWSKHVDVNPGDRAEVCGGMMKPVDLYMEGQDWIITHECQKCDFTRRQKVVDEDDFEEVIRLEQEINRKKTRG